MEVRAIEPERDADACVALLRETAPRAVTSRAAWLHRTASLPERVRLSGFVAEHAGRVVGESYGFLGLFGDDTVAICNVMVTAAERRQGVGTALLQAVEERFAGALLARFEESPEGTAFAAAHGFREVRAEAESVLDLTGFAGEPPPEVDLRPVSAIDPHDAHLVDNEASRDMPMT
jgi:GNAT superfamily N-acetyltransferase